MRRQYQPCPVGYSCSFSLERSARLRGRIHQQDLTVETPRRAAPPSCPMTPMACHGTRARPGTSTRLGRGHRNLSRRRRTLAQPQSISAAGSGSARSISSSTAVIPTRSFRNVLLRLPHEQAVDLYDEVLERIQTNYVDPVPLEPLVRHGLDNLEVALRDPGLRQDQRSAGHPRSRRLAARYARAIPCALATFPTGSAAIRMATRELRGGSAVPSGCRRRRSCWSSPAARATLSTISPAT